MESAVIPAAIATSLLILLVLERIINAILATVWHLTIGFEKDEAKYSFAAMQLMSSTASVTSRASLTIINSIVTSISGMVTWLLIIALLIIFTGMLYLGYEQYPIIARGFVKQWNAYIGPQIHSVLVVPLDILTLFLKAFLPLYNAVTFIVGKLVHVGVLKPLLLAPEKMLQAISASTNISRSTAISINQYVGNTFGYTIDQSSQQPAWTQCLESSPNSKGCARMMEIGPRTLDLITPMMHVRSLAAVIVSWLGQDVCSPLSPVLDIATYPLMDISFAKGVHNLMNGVLWLTVQISIVTEARCRLYKATDGLAMCIPDFEPVTRFWVEALHNFGQMLDNWLDIVLVVVQGVLSPGTMPKCSASPLSTLSVHAGEYHKQVFGSNFSVVVGLTENMFAMTDGVSVIYYSTAKMEMSSEVALDAWPMEVDVKMGIAAVQYESTDTRDDTGSGATTSMLGCRYI